jgi:hypothetical protein
MFLQNSDRLDAKFNRQNQKPMKAQLNRSISHEKIVISYPLGVSDKLFRQFVKRMVGPW